MTHNQTVNARFVMELLGVSYQVFCKLKSTDPRFPVATHRAADGFHYPLPEVIRYFTRKVIRGEVADL